MIIRKFFEKVIGVALYNERHINKVIVIGIITGSILFLCNVIISVIERRNFEQNHFNSWEEYSSIKDDKGNELVSNN
ncbi:MAG: hypothetical protein E7208_10890 [Clostridium butyricum]|nr:hypothetical protein [Clostridium butyricum]